MPARRRFILDGNTAMPHSDANEPSFVVTDRRHFTSAGERRHDVPDAPEPAAAAIELNPPARPAPAPEPAGKAAGRRAEPAKGNQIPFPAPAPAPAPLAEEPAAEPAAEPGGPIGFIGFLESLYASAMMQLGATAPGQLSRPEPDYEGARQTIEILGLLQQKTNGNLTAEEAQVLEEILYELRMVYVQLTRKRAR